ncbi:hypothetical protein Phi48:2_gp04 [Cellulophaga phage phi48:2]|uniref:hypothetical protein n=1 Tax=Cellulophaga phage phi48:2 TaxID=1327968 RepID=UPI000351BCED|nr:hypothetical protein Phi48:2_gp04 [Cellulophaga phage phi48:2]AGO47252.1 hypothetical protein Phi48:2_gp04 [Cellulophaga phage phi48:2]
MYLHYLNFHERLQENHYFIVRPYNDEIFVNETAMVYKSENLEWLIFCKIIAPEKFKLKNLSYHHAEKCYNSNTRHFKDKLIELFDLNEDSELVFFELHRWEGDDFQKRALLNDFLFRDSYNFNSTIDD